MVEAVLDVRDPKKVAAGRAGALRRWGPPGTRVARLGDLTPEQRDLVLTLVAAVKSKNKVDETV
jgi:hypothetical protein